MINVFLIVSVRQHLHTLLVSLTNALEKLQPWTVCWSSDMNTSGLLHLA